MTTALQRDMEACERAKEVPADALWGCLSKTCDDRLAVLFQRSRTRWPRALAVVEAVKRWGDVYHLPDDIVEALRAFEDETT